MNQKELKELIEFLVEKDIAEFEMERGDLKLHVKRGSGAVPPPAVLQVAAAPAQVVPVAPVAAMPVPATPPSSQAGNGATAAPAQEAASEASLHVVKSPIVGTFYESPSPGSPPFISIGDSVKEGQVLCIIEAMKLMNEIEADASGEIVKCFVANGSPVEYGMPLFGLRTS
jgi:acetyl-CoA carboxylase biotin carboxyl carrier protein